MLMRWCAVPALLMALTGLAQAADCPDLLQGSLPKLRAKESIDLCKQYADKPLVVVNTASFCGFAPQFEGLEALNKRYKAQGLEMLGVPSNDFKQESRDSAETAKVCYANYGVTFNMTEPQKSNAPKWNFYKYVVDRQGKVVASFSSLTKPDDPEFIAAIEKAIASKPLKP
jgi:glutathione peroxidase